MSFPTVDPSDRTRRPGSERYKPAGTVVSFEARRCLHQTECIKGLPTVFDVERRPWTDVGA
ncbi:(4Fe-4S)-binding protein [Streptomyces fulvorobeus]|uniref:(4Fe-4S)-binding protein n=1 Tax=Streptomyces fulvorobeus TaxID=284028 RepID=UPI00156708CB|nr:(4Fe-4S)-binding protein [Streptomyces fulvorobeus]